MSNDQQTDFVLDRDSQKYILEELIEKVPELVYLGPLHVAVCQKISEKKNFSEEYHKVYTNLLVSHSKKAKIITALITLVQKGKISLAQVECDYIDNVILQDHINVENVSFSVNESQSQSYFGKGLIKRLFIKWAAHRVYRFFFNVRCTPSVMIRSWVEITRKMYGDHFPRSLILIYPFSLNFHRHKDYIKSCFKEFKHVSLCGVPYRFVDWFKILLNPQDTDRGYVQFEYNGYLKHGQELVKKGLKQMYTSDEFEAGAFVMAEYIREHGGHVTNTAHGLSFGAPYTSYDFFSVYNEAQRKYYGALSQKTQFEVSPRINAGAADLVKFDGSKGYVLIYIEANFERLGMVFETDLETRVVASLREVGKSLSIKVVVKAHPNRKSSEYENYTAATGVEIVRHLSEIQNYSPIFITIVSAAYYDFRQFGPFVFVDDGYSNIENFYGEQVKVHSVESLEQAIDECVKNELQEC